MNEKLSPKILDQISVDLELLERIVSCYSLADKTAEVSPEQAENLYLDPKVIGKNSFHLWSLETYKSYYFLVGSEINFFEKDHLYNPFEESDEFYSFQKDIRGKLGFEYSEPYESDSGYYLTTAIVDGIQLSFFLYKA